MKELTDYSGPFKPDLRFEDFSKDFLLKLMNVWQFAWIRMADAWYGVVKERFGFDAANDCNLEAWPRIGERVNPRYAKIANIQLNTVVDSLKCLQLPLDNNIGPLYPVEYDIKNENHVIMTLTQCGSLLFYEKAAPEMIEPVCHVLEKPVMEKYLINPKIQVTPLKLPPRKSQDEIACQWEYKLEVPEGVRVRSKAEVVDETTDIPELTDLSGPFYPNLTHRNFSKDFLLKLIHVWQYAWLHMTEAWYEAVKKRFGSEAANDCELEAWIIVGERVNPRYPKVANIQVTDDITSCLKCLQLPLDNITGGLYPAELDIKSKNLAILTLKKCRSLEFFEEKDPERIKTLCPSEGKVMEKYLVHPKAKATPLKLPPRKNPEEIACQWEFKIEE